MSVYRNNWKKASGSLTLYMTLMLVMSTLFILGLLELVRVYGMHSVAQEVTNLVVESAFGEYQPLLWNQYEFMALDKSKDIESNMAQLTLDNLNDTDGRKGINLYQMQLNKAEVCSYELITDRDGAAFQAQVASIMKSKLGKDAAKKILEKITGIQGIDGGNEQLEQKMGNASETLKELEETKNNMTEQEKGSMFDSKLKKGAPVESQHGNNPVDVVTGMKQQGLLAILLPNGNDISANKVDVSKSLLRRELKKGNYKGSSNSGWYERILLQEYISTRFGNYLEPADNKSLIYEQEYILCGNNSDKRNLEETAERLLLLRSAINYGYLLTDGTKQAEALTVATALAGVTANPAIIEIVRQGIIAAWALAESISDIRCLMAGGKVPLLKTADNWKMQISNLGEAVSSGAENSSKDGYSYEEYLQGLLYLMSLKHIAYQTMDLMEFSLHQSNQYSNANMDEMIDYIHVKNSYVLKSIFLSAIKSKYSLGDALIQKEAEYSYIR